MAAHIIAFIWGFAEATLFFIIPDVALSVITLSGRDIGLTAAYYSLAGALTGGAIMFAWGKNDLERVTRILHRIPAIPAKDIEKVRTDLQKSGVGAIFLGPLFGIPYKIYAAYAHSITSLGIFLLISVPARGVRFIFIALATSYIFDTFFPQMPYPTQVQIVLASWVGIYVFYFIKKSR